MGAALMRRAKKEGYWRAIERNQGWKIGIDHLTFNDIPGIGTGGLRFESSLNLLCGPNGVGKTTLLKAIGAALDPAQAKESATTRFRVSKGQMTVAVRADDTTETIVTNFTNIDSAPGWVSEVETFYVDTSSVVSDLQNYYCNFPDIQDAVNGVPMLQVTDESLELLSFLTNIPYTAARVFTLEEGERDSSDCPSSDNLRQMAV